MNKGKIYVMIIGICVAVIMSFSILVSMANERIANDSNNSNVNIMENISQEESVEQSVAIDETNLSNEMIEERLNKRVQLVELATPLEVEE